MIISAFSASLIRENVLTVIRLNKAVSNNHSCSPFIIVRGRNCGEAVEGAVVNGDIVADTINNVINEDGRLSRTASVLEGTVLYRQVDRSAAPHCKS